LNNPTQAQDEQGAGVEASAITVTGTFIDPPASWTEKCHSVSWNRAVLPKVEAARAMSQRRQGLFCQAMNRGVANKMDGSWHSGADRADDGG
jgi:hypothetical protein